MMDILLTLLILGGGYWLYSTGQLNQFLSGAKLPTIPGPRQQEYTPPPPPPKQSAPQAPPQTITGARSVGGDKIYPDASPPHACNNVSDGGLEQGGDRKEPQIACGFPFLNCEATVYINYHGINDTLSVKLRGPKHGGGTAEADMCNNIHYIGLGGAKPAFGKQAGHTAEYCEFGNSISIPENQWVGVKAIEWNEGNGVHFQTWLQVPEGSQWKLVADAVDNGGSGSCKGPASAPYTKSPCSTGQVSIGFRVDGLKSGGDVQFKNMSIREISRGSGPSSTVGGGNIGGGRSTVIKKVAYAKAYDRILSRL